jgi:hypothetical protein
MAISPEAVRAEIEQHVRSIVELFAGNGRKAALARAARALQMPESRVTKLYYGLARRIEAHEADNIRAFMKSAENLVQARAEYEAKWREFTKSRSHSVLNDSAKH